jgi:hypothetical protein
MKLESPSTKKIVSYEYLHSSLFENMSEGMQKLHEGVFWLVLKDQKKTLVPITKSQHFGKSCFVCSLIPGTFMTPQSLAQAYDELKGSMLPTFKSLSYLDEQ